MLGDTAFVKRPSPIAGLKLCVIDRLQQFVMQPYSRTALPSPAFNRKLSGGKPPDCVVPRGGHLLQHHGDFQLSLTL